MLHCSIDIYPMDRGIRNDREGSATAGVAQEYVMMIVRLARFLGEIFFEARTLERTMSAQAGHICP